MFWTKNTNFKSIQAVNNLHQDKAGFSEIIDFIEKYKQKEKEILMPIISKYLSYTVALAIIFLAICAAITLTIIYVSPIIHGFNTIILELMAAIATVSAFTPLFISEEYFNLYTKINKIHRPISDANSYITFYESGIDGASLLAVKSFIMDKIKSNQNDPSKKDIKMPALQKISLQEICGHQTMQISLLK